MPFSSDNGKALIDRVIRRLGRSDLKILDVGAGSATYFNRYANTLLPKSKNNKWYAIEIWEPFIEKYKLKDKYDEVFVGPATTVIQSLFYKGFTTDVTFVGDVLEHMTKEDAVQLVRALRQMSDITIISIPLGYYPQGEFDGNPYEKHITDNWTHEDVMATFEGICWSGIDGEIGVYVISNKLAQLVQPKIAVYGICKNEIQFVDRFMDSVKDADYVVICDTGSTDGTAEALKAKGAIVYDMHVNPWRFDDARNSALMFVPDTADLCISLDMDEYLQEGWRELLYNEINTHFRTRGKLFDHYHCRFNTIWDWQSIKDDSLSTNTSSHWHERIHTRHNWKWRLPVHEILTYTGNGAPQAAWLGGFTMYQKPIFKEGRKTYLPMLEQSLKEDPNVWKSWFFYAADLLKEGRLQDATNALETALGIPGADKSYLHMVLGDYYAKFDALKAMVNYQHACQLAPKSRERWVKLALFCRSEKNDFVAAKAIQKAKECESPSSGYDYDAWCWGEGFEKLYKDLTE